MLSTVAGMSIRSSFSQRVHAQTDQRVRAPTDYFIVHDLVAAWSDLAALKQPGFAWAGTDYPAFKRGMAISRIGLCNHLLPLHALIDLCPGGFPCHAQLKWVLEFLHERHSIFGSGIEDLGKTAGLAADRWRIMAKDLIRLKFGNAKGCSPPLADMLAKVKVTPNEVRRKPAAAQAGASSGWLPDDLDLDAGDDAGDDVAFCDEVVAVGGEESNDVAEVSHTAAQSAGHEPDIQLGSIKCMCPDCLNVIRAAATVIDVPSDGEAMVIGVADCCKGGQKRQTKPAEEGDKPEEVVRRKPAAAPTLQKRMRISSKSKPAQSSPSAASIVIKTSVVNRLFKPVSAYILRNGKYFVRQTQRVTPAYFRHLKHLELHVKSGEIADKPGGKAVLQHMLIHNTCPVCRAATP